MDKIVMVDEMVLCPTMDLGAVLLKDGKVQLMRTMSWEKLWTLGGGEGISAMCWSPDGKRLAVGHETGRVRILDVDAEDGDVGSEIGMATGPLMRCHQRTPIRLMQWSEAASLKEKKDDYELAELKGMEGSFHFFERGEHLLERPQLDAELLEMYKSEASKKTGKIGNRIQQQAEAIILTQEDLKTKSGRARYTGKQDPLDVHHYGLHLTPLTVLVTVDSENTAIFWHGCNVPLCKIDLQNAAAKSMIFAPDLHHWALVVVEDENSQLVLYDTSPLVEKRRELLVVATQFDFWNDYLESARQGLDAAYKKLKEALDVVENLFRDLYDKIYAERKLAITKRRKPLDLTKAEFPVRDDGFIDFFNRGIDAKHRAVINLLGDQTTVDIVENKMSEESENDDDDDDGSSEDDEKKEDRVLQEVKKDDPIGASERKSLADEPPWYVVSCELSNLLCNGIPTEAMTKWFEEHIPNESACSRLKSQVDALLVEATECLEMRFLAAVKLLHYRASEMSALPQANPRYEALGLDEEILHKLKIATFDINLGGDEVLQAFHLARRKVALILAYLTTEGVLFQRRKSAAAKGKGRTRPGIAGEVAVSPVDDVPTYNPPRGTQPQQSQKKKKKPTDKKSDFPLLGYSHKCECMDMFYRATLFYEDGDSFLRKPDSSARTIEVIALGPVSLLDKICDVRLDEMSFLKNDREPRDYEPAGEYLKDDTIKRDPELPPSAIEKLTLCRLLEGVTSLAITTFDSVRPKIADFIQPAARPVPLPSSKCELHGRYEKPKDDGWGSHFAHEDPPDNTYDVFAALPSGDHSVHVLKILDRYEYEHELPNLFIPDDLKIFMQPPAVAEEPAALKFHAWTLRFPHKVLGFKFYGAENGIASKNSERLAVLLRKYLVPGDEDDDDRHFDELWLLNDAAFFDESDVLQPLDLDRGKVIDVDPESDDVDVLPLHRKRSIDLSITGGRGVVAVRSTPNFLALYDCEDLDDDDDDDSDEEEEEEKQDDAMEDDDDDDDDEEPATTTQQIVIE